MKFHYLIAAYNEAEILPELVAKLSIIPEKFPGSQVLIVDNASTDNSKEILLELMRSRPWLVALFEEQRGLGVAFHLGLRHLKEMNLNSEDWIAFNGADLPFGFSDLHAFLEIYKDFPKSFLFIGSKSHPDSVTNRGFKRVFASWIFQLLRTIFLQMKTKDPQGTLFLRADQMRITDQIKANDYFFTTELVYFSEKKSQVVELPIKAMPQRRASKVRLVSDGMKAIRQIFHLKKRMR